MHDHRRCASPVGTIRRIPRAMRLRANSTSKHSIILDLITIQDTLPTYPPISDRDTANSRDSWLSRVGGLNLMHRRSFLKRIASAIIATTLAKQLCAQSPEPPKGESIDYWKTAGYEVVQDPHPMRFSLKDGKLERAPYEAVVYSRACIFDSIEDTRK